MENENRVFFPLRSNVAWYREPGLQEELSNLIKESILVYDDIYIEDGTLITQITERNSIEMYCPPGLPPEERIIEYDRDIKQGKVHLKILNPNTNYVSHLKQNEITVAKYKLDYYDILNGIEPNDFDFLKLVTLPTRNKIPPELKLIIDTRTKFDEDSYSDLQIPKLLKRYIIESVNHDIVFSTYLKSAAMLDQTHYNLIKRKCSPYNGLTQTPSPEVLALKRLIEIPAPNFYKMEIAEAIDLRDDQTWIDFRNAVTNISLNIQETPGILNDPAELDKLVNYYCNNLIMAGLKKSQFGKKKLLINLGLNIFSTVHGYGDYLSIAGGIKSVYDYMNNSSWTAFLMKLEQFK